MREQGKLSLSIPAWHLVAFANVSSVLLFFLIVSPGCREALHGEPNSVTPRACPSPLCRTSLVANAL